MSGGEPAFSAGAYVVRFGPRLLLIPAFLLPCWAVLCGFVLATTKPPVASYVVGAIVSAGVLTGCGQAAASR